MPYYQYILSHQTQGSVTLGADSNSPQSPINWKDIDYTLSRDPVFTGLSFEFSQTSIGFVGQAAEFVKAIFEVEGIQAKVELQINIDTAGNGSFENLFEGHLNLTEYEEQEYKVFANIENNGLYQTFITRLDQEFDVIADTTLGGVDISSTNEGLTQRLMLGSRPIFYRATIVIDNANYAEGNTSFLEASINELTADFIDFDEDKLVVQENYIGEYEISVTGTYEKPNTNPTLDLIVAGTTYNLVDQSDNLTGSISYQLTVVLQQEDEINLFVNISQQAAFLTLTDARITIKAKTVLADIEVKCDYIGQVFQKAITRLLDNEAQLHSEVFGVDENGVFSKSGSYHDYALLNGFLLRNFPDSKNYPVEFIADSKPFNVTFKKLFESANAIFNIGLAFEGDRVRVEDKAYFYQNETAIIIENIDKLISKPAHDRIFSSWQIGYKDYEDDGDINDGLLGFHGTHQYKTPIDTYESKFAEISEFVADMYSIELTRRQQFSGATKRGFKYDKDTFIINVKDNDAFTIRDVRADDLVQYAGDATDVWTFKNLRITPKRNLKRWENMLCASVWWHSGDVGRFISGDPNTRAISRFNNETDNIEERGDVVIDSSKALFKPMEYRFTGILTKSDFDIIKANVRSKVGVYDHKGDLKTGWIEELRYDVENSKGQFILLAANE